MRVAPLASHRATGDLEDSMVLDRLHLATRWSVLDLADRRARHRDLVVGLALRAVAPLALGSIAGALLARRFVLWRSTSDVVVDAALVTAVGIVPLWISLRSARQRDAVDGVAGLATVTGCVILDLDEHARTRRVLGESSTVLGRSVAELVGRRELELVDPADRPLVRELMAEAARSGGWHGRTVRFLDHDAGTITTRTSGAVRRNASGRVVGYTVTIRPEAPAAGPAAARVAASAAVADVLAQRSLTVQFQPLVSATSCRIVGAEALARFPAREGWSPHTWFAEAHQIGRGLELELLALEQAIEGARQLPEHLYVSLNVSPSTLLSEQLLHTLDRAWLPAERVVLELTEHVYVDAYDRLAGRRVELRARGVRLAVDDAGAGFASFRHIVRLEPDMIKLDRELIAGIDHDLRQQALAAALVMYASEVGCTIVAEGIETAGEMAAVIALGVDTMQGYALGRPTDDADELLRWDVLPRQWERTRASGHLQRPRPHVEPAFDAAGPRPAH